MYNNLQTLVFVIEYHLNTSTPKDSDKLSFHLKLPIYPYTCTHTVSVWGNEWDYFS